LIESQGIAASNHLFHSFARINFRGMNSISFQKSVLPHLIAILVFLAIGLFLYSPVVLEGKVLDSNDINQGAGASRETVEFREQNGEEALWTNSMFSGMPAYLISLHWSGAFLTDIAQQLLQLHLPRPLGEHFVLFLGFYLLLLAAGLRPVLALSGALAFGLGTFLGISIEAGHMWKIRAIAYMPMVLAGFLLIYKGRLLPGFLAASLALALEIHANHLQITYYLALLLLIFGLAELIRSIREKEIGIFLRRSALALMAVVLAAGLNTGRLWTTYEYGKYSTRGASELSAEASPNTAGLEREYAFRWSSGKWETLTLLVPHLYGGASGGYRGRDSETSRVLRQNNVPADQIRQIEAGTLGYWGDQPFTAGPVYAGAVVCFLFVLGLMVVEARMRNWIVAAAVLSVLLSWGSNFAVFNNFMFDYFPGYNKFRAVTMAIVIALCCLPLLGLVAVGRMFEQGWNKALARKFLIALGVTGGLAVLIALFARPPRLEMEQFPAWLLDAIQQDRAGIVRTDALRSLFFIAAAAALIYFTLQGKVGRGLAGGLLVALIVLDLLPVNTRYLHKERFVPKGRQTFLQATEADQQVQEDGGLHFRVLNLQNPFNEARTSYFHHSIGGYHGAKMRRYQDLIERHLDREMQAIVGEGRLTRENTRVLSMLNTRYLLAGNTREAVIPNRSALGNAWFVRELRPVDSPDEEIAALNDSDPAYTAVINTGQFDPPSFGYDSAARIELTEYSPNTLKYRTESSEDGLAVFSEVYYPVGWTARIDGQEIPLLRVNYLLRALPVPAGQHTVEMQFAPDSYFKGNWFNRIFGLAYLALLLVAGIYEVRKRRSLASKE
jgi:hypothetical protein